MWLFWLVIIFMLLLSLSIVLKPLLQQPMKTRVKREKFQLQQYQKQLNILSEKLHNNNLTQQEFSTLRNELQTTLLKKVPHQDVAWVRWNKGQRWFSMAALVMGIPLLALLMYFHYGSSLQVANWRFSQTHQKEIAALSAELKTPEQVVERIKARLARSPKDVKGWYLLGRLYASMGRFSEAAKAFARANKLKPHQIMFMTQYAEALFFANKQQLQGKSLVITQQILAKDPVNRTALNLLAMDAYKQKKYQTAIKNWRKILVQMQAIEPEYQILLTAIEKAKSKLKRSSN